MFVRISAICLFLFTLFMGVKIMHHFSGEVTSKHSIDTTLHKKTHSDNVKIVVYIKTNCVYCKLAKNLLLKYGLNHKMIELTNNQELSIRLVNQTGQTTVPYIFINDKFIGGYKNLHHLIKKGEL